VRLAPRLGTTTGPTRRARPVLGAVLVGLLPLASGTHAATAGQRRAAPPAERRFVIGYSLERRPIVAILVGSERAPRRMLVVGCTHGNETAGIPVADALAASGPVRGVALWIVPTMNPDGVAARTRANARGVDLNRNFPDAWRPLGPRGSAEYAGARPLSEPESRAMASLIEAVRPGVAVWFHQPLGLVDDSEGPRRLERLFAARVGLPLTPLPDYPGSAIGWEDHLVANSAFVVELPPGQLSPASRRRYVAALRTLAAGAPPTTPVARAPARLRLA